jgi:pimeloyl-ACP methyl ester carboxylesterase
MFVEKPRMMLELVEHGPHGQALVLLLHDGEGRPEHLDDFADHIRARRLVIPRAPRWASMRGPGLFSWFTSPARGTLDPITFGDSLTQLEMLLLSFDGPSGIGAVGIGQGATILTALSALWPERFTWTVLVGGFWPELPEDLLPRRGMAGLPVLVMPDLNGGHVDGSRLSERGAIVVSRPTREADRCQQIADWIDTRADLQEDWV